ncbi:MAG: DUF512 domain-containing protein, partial [Clostridium sp.]|nr:DUF512 domain-containing protein [Clostridium sp.]
QEHSQEHLQEQEVSQVYSTERYTRDFTKEHIERSISLATGKLAYPMILQMTQRIYNLDPSRTFHVYAIENRFFGEKITVSGLITGQDLCEQLRGQELGECLLLPENMLRAQGDLFLDDMSVQELERTLQVPIRIVKSSGADFIRSCIDDSSYL